MEYFIKLSGRFFILFLLLWIMIAHMVHIYFLLCQLTHLIRVEMLYCQSKIELNIVDSNCSSNNLKCDAIKMHIFQLALKSPLICFLNWQAGAQGTFSGPQVYSILSLPPWGDQGSSGRLMASPLLLSATETNCCLFRQTKNPAQSSSVYTKIFSISC